MAETKKLYGFDGVNIVEVKTEKEVLTDEQIKKLESQGYKKV